MPSSIFSSSRSIPRERWGPLFVGVLAATGVTLAGTEVALRSRGFVPSTKDSAELWATARVAAGRLGPEGLALVGSSRLQLDLQPSLLSQALNRPIAQLGIRGGSPLPVLRHLAEDPTFHGSVICEVLPTKSFGEPLDLPTDRADIFLESYRHRTFMAVPETSVRARLESSLTFLQPETSLRTMAVTFATGKGLPAPLGERSFPDRFHYIDFDLLPANAGETGEKAFVALFESDRVVPTEAELAARLALVETWVHAIQDRGGRVLFVRMPSSGSLRAVEDRRYPRAKYWDRLAASTSAATLHYEDSEALRRFKCPDGSHITYGDTPAFTRAFAEELERRQLLAPRAPVRPSPPR